MSRLNDEPCDPSEAEARDYIAGKLTAVHVRVLSEIQQGTWKPSGHERRALKALLAFAVIVKQPSGFEYWSTPRGAWVLARLERDGRRWPPA